MSFGCGISGVMLSQGLSDEKNIPLRAACYEAGDERKSKSENLDRSRSGLNTYDMPEGCDGSGASLADWYEARFKEMSDARVAKGGHKFGVNAKYGVAFTVTPDEEEAAHWDDATRQKFKHDAAESFAVWNYGRAPDAVIEHRDEGSIGTDDWPFDYGTVDDNYHLHLFSQCLTEDGRLAVSKTWNNASRKSSIHRVFVAEMRKRGWDMEPHKTRRERAKSGEEKQAGRSANEYKRTERAARRNRAKAAKLEAATKAANASADNAMQAADAANERAKEHAEARADLIDETKKASQERTELAEERSAALQAQADAETGAFRASLAQAACAQATADAEYEAETHRVAIAKAKAAEAQAKEREREADEAKKAAEAAKAETEKQRAEIIRQAQREAAKVRADAQTEAETARAEAKDIRAQARAEGLADAKRKAAQAVAKINAREATVADRIAAADVYAAQAKAEAVDTLQSPTKMAMAWLRGVADAMAESTHPLMVAVGTAARKVLDYVGTYGNRSDLDARARDYLRAEAREAETQARHRAAVIAGREKPDPVEHACGETRQTMRRDAEKKADDITRSPAWRDAQIDAPHGGRVRDVPGF